MPRRSKRTPAPVALVGGGELSEKALKQHLSDFVESQSGEILWVVPFSENSSKTFDAALDFLVEEGASYRVVSDDTLEDADLEKYSAEWTVHQGEDAHALAVQGVAEAETNLGVLLLLDEKLDSDLDLLQLAANAGLAVFDVCAGLQRIELETSDAAAAPEAGEPEETPAEVAEPSTPAVGGMPEEALDAINAGETADAVNVLKALSKDDLVALAEAQGLEGPGDSKDPWKGIHRKTIAADIVDLLSQASADVPAEETDEEPAAAPEEPQKPKKKSTRRTTPEKTPEPVEERSEAPVQKEGQLAPVRDVEVPTRVIEMLAYVAAQQGTEDAEKFYSFLKSEGLLV